MTQCKTAAVSIFERFSPRPVPIAVPPCIENGTSDPSLAAAFESLSSKPAENNWFRATSAAAPSAEPPAIPPAIGTDL